MGEFASPNSGTWISEYSLTGKQLKLVILDRDGVINQDSDQPVKSEQEWIPIDGSLEAIAALNQAGYKVVIATEQSGLGLGLFNIDALNAMHNKMHRALDSLGAQIEAVLFCPHTPEDNCDCRKPNSGMLQQIRERFFTELEDVPVISNGQKALESALAVGAQPMLVLTGKGNETLQALDKALNIPVYDNLASAVDALLDDN